MKKYSLDELLNFSDQLNCSAADLLKFTGQLIDSSFDYHSHKGIEKAFKWLAILKSMELTSSQLFEVYYFEGNAWSAKRQLSFKINKSKSVWEYETKHIEKEIISLKTAIKFAPINNDKILTYRLCQAYTNLGNLFNSIGRYIEAIWYYDKVIDIDSKFAMAYGNKGIALKHYGAADYDIGHSLILFQFATDSINKALNFSHLLEGNAKEGFEDSQKILNGWLKNYRQVELKDFPLGNNDMEIKYREWCLKERLFLNSINDIGEYPIIAHDILTLPNMVAPISEPPYLYGFYSWLKQEFVSARYLLYKGCTRKKTHFSDENVLVYDTLDYPLYSYNTELIKLSFRSFYSLLDKISYFINDYFKLKVPSHKVSFKSIWYKPNSKEIRPEFKQSTNWPLYGLFWLSKDIHEDDKDFKEAIEPEAKNWREYRNCLEHKYLKIIEHEITKQIGNSLLKEPLGERATRDYFLKSTLSLARLIRAALIYLAFSVHWEERKGKGPGIYPPASLDAFDDNWKI